MKKIASLIRQIEMAEQLLILQCEQQRLQLTEQHLLRLLAAHRKISLAENTIQVKNARSHMSSTNE